MAWIDSSRNVLVVRIVYDGPAMSGKTTSMRALADGVARTVECPEEREGRTVYFDWLEYTAGLFEGRQIRCQIVSVPGQQELAERRQLLIDGADAVVCVLDTRRPELSFGLGWLAELRQRLRPRSPSVGIVVQANKRDAADAVPREELHQRLAAGIAGVAVVDAVATHADGVRETFVLAVRLALDRVRALAQEGTLGVDTPNEDSADELLRALRRADDPGSVQAELPAPSRPTLAPEQQPLPELVEPSFSRPGPTLRPGEAWEELPFVPDPALPGGMIWPPVDGRALLHEVAGLQIRPRKTTRGEWWGSGAGWRFQSGADALYADVAEARLRLIDWARVHAENASCISLGRAVILADAGHGRVRLWQLMRVGDTLREQLDSALAEGIATAVARGILEVAIQLLAAQAWFARASVPFHCTLWTVSAAPSAPRYVGVMPELGSPVAQVESSRDLLERELLPHLRELRRSRIDFGEVLRELRAGAASAADPSLRTLGDVMLAVA